MIPRRIMDGTRLDPGGTKVQAGLRFSGSQFWVIHRRRAYGPFDYQWSKDFSGIELQYQGEKFGEYCSVEEIYADLKPFRLPMRVVEVASVVLGATLYGLLNGLSEEEKRDNLVCQLKKHGLGRFAESIVHTPHRK